MYNLPPVHVLISESFVNSLIDELLQEKDFSRRYEGARPSWVGRLKNKKLSSATHTFREKENAKAKLPLSLFM